MYTCHAHTHNLYVCVCMYVCGLLLVRALRTVKNGVKTEQVLENGKLVSEKVNGEERIAGSLTDGKKSRSKKGSLF